MKLPLSCILLAALLLTACGQSGDLYLPDNPPESVRKREAEQKKRAEERQAPQAEPAPIPAAPPTQEPQ